MQANLSQPTNVEVDTASPVGTPDSTSRKRKAGMITLAQKQALVDNLQLEGE